MLINIVEFPPIPTEPAANSLAWFAESNEM